MGFNLDAFRVQFPITEAHAYLNHAGIGPLSLPVIQAMTQMAQCLGVRPLDSMWEDLAGISEEVRELGARLTGAELSDEIVQVSGTAMGINIAAQGLPLDAGDNVLVLETDYPALIYPWMNLSPRGILTRFVPTPDGGLDLDLLESHIDARTRVICISTCMFRTGYRNDIEAVGRLCRERGIFFVLDAIQTLGYLPVDVRKARVDVLAAGSHKWLMAGTGNGLLYVRREVLERMRLGPYVGALSVVDPMAFERLDFTLAPTSDRFTLSSGSFAVHAGMRAALRLLLDQGIEAIGQRVLHLNRVAAEDLAARGYEIASDMEEGHRSGLLIVRVPDREAAYERLTRAGVVVSMRGAGIRIAPHAYNTEEEVLRVGEVLGNR